MTRSKYFDVIIIGGSYSGLSAAMALGRASRNVLVIDDQSPCNIQTPHSHNFLTHDGEAPSEIASLAKRQVQHYRTVSFRNARAMLGKVTKTGFEIQTDTQETFGSKKLIFATGIKDIMPALKGFRECWGISLLHCPYCHGYEVRNEPTGILGNGEHGFEFAGLLSNWTRILTLYTNGPSSLTPAQTNKMVSHGIRMVETEIHSLGHIGGYLERVNFKGGTSSPVKVLYARPSFEQHCPIPESLGVTLNDDGYIKVDTSQKTSVPGLYACGDNASRVRTIANAVSMGATAGMMVNKEMIFETF